jgi:hypothetical protein
MEGKHAHMSASAVTAKGSTWSFNDVEPLRGGFAGL